MSFLLVIGALVVAVFVRVVAFELPAYLRTVREETAPRRSENHTTYGSFLPGDRL